MAIDERDIAQAQCSVLVPIGMLKWQCFRPRHFCEPAESAERIIIRNYHQTRRPNLAGALSMKAFGSVFIPTAVVKIAVAKCIEERRFSVHGPATFGSPFII